MKCPLCKNNLYVMKYQIKQRYIGTNISYCHKCKKLFELEIREIIGEGLNE